MTSPTFPRLAGASLLVSLLAACGGGEDAPSAADPPDAVVLRADELAGVSAAASQALLAARSEQAVQAYGTVTQPVVEPQRRSADGQWVFGGTYLPIPPQVEDAAPVHALFIARRVGDAWQVTLEDAEGFDDLMSQASADLASDDERRLYARRAERRQAGPEASALAGGGYDIGLSLPYRQNDAGWGMWGVHGDGGATRPFNAIDFMGGDGRVLASRGGVAYRFCGNGRSTFIKVVHDNGYTTGYYHLRQQPSIRNGQRVQEGDYLGMIGTELPCGGSANGNHVHWTLWRGGSNGRAEPVDGKVIGGWTFHESNRAYAGHAERNGRRVQYNGRGLVNYGHGRAAAAF